MAITHGAAATSHTFRYHAIAVTPFFDDYDAITMSRCHYADAADVRVDIRFIAAATSLLFSR